jgi:hypothetical protein
MRSSISISCLAAVLFGVLIIPAPATATDRLRGDVIGDPVGEVKLTVRRLESRRHAKIERVRVRKAPYACDDGTTLHAGFLFRQSNMQIRKRGRFGDRFGRHRRTVIVGRVRKVGHRNRRVLATGRIEDFQLGPGPTACRARFRFQAVD